MKDKTRHKIGRWFWGLILGAVAAVVLMLLIVWVFADIPSFEELENPDSKLATELISEDGRVLTTYHIENRTFVQYDQLSPNIVNAAVATEDVRFYKHSGIDFKGLARVFVKTLIMGRSSQGGGSTITQQLAKSLYPRADMSSKVPGWSKVKMVWIKLKEWITAVKLERDYTKNEIVSMYLNSIFFGSSAYGIRAASETFFSKDPSELTVEESALLVGMVNKPTRYNPVLNPDKSLARRNFVIGQMCKAGYISKAQRDSIQQIPIALNFQVQDHNAGLAPYFRDMLRKYMNAEKPKHHSYKYTEDYSTDSLLWAMDDLYGWLNKNKKPDGSRYDLDKDGLRIYTTLNYKMQKYAEEAVAEHLGNTLQKSFFRDLRWKTNKPFSNDVDSTVRATVMSQARKWSDRWRLQRKAGVPEQEILKQFSKPAKMRVFAWNSKGYIDTTMTPDDSIKYYKSILRASFMAIEPNTGHVKAWVGGPNYRWFKYDNVLQGKRQVGSTIKPFLYTLAMQEGMTPCDKVVNVPQTFLEPDGSTWSPRSTDKDEDIGKVVTLKWGLTHSSNNISAYLMKQFGPHAMVETMHRMGIRSHVDEVDALCAGPADLSLYEMVAAYNTFPSMGVYTNPIFVTRIEDRDGNTISEFNTRQREAISASNAYLMANLMEGVINNGTGARLRSVYKLRGQISGKTGTTNDNADGWFIGYTPSITAGIWVGAEDRQVHFQSLALGSGSNMALPIWGIWMNKVLSDGTLGISESDRFVVPAGISVNLDCSGGVEDESIQKKETGNYFFD